ncbi:putative reverse transcriptase domain, viral movement protein [Tanacetum coccineum]
MDLKNSSTVHSVNTRESEPEGVKGGEAVTEGQEDVVQGVEAELVKDKQIVADKEERKTDDVEKQNDEEDKEVEAVKRRGRGRKRGESSPVKRRGRPKKSGRDGSKATPKSSSVKMSDEDEDEDEDDDEDEDFQAVGKKSTDLPIKRRGRPRKSGGSAGDQGKVEGTVKKNAPESTSVKTIEEDKDVEAVETELPDPPIKKLGRSRKSGGTSSKAAPESTSVKMIEVEEDEDVEAVETELPDSPITKKLGRPRKSEGNSQKATSKSSSVKMIAKEKEEEDVCFICFDGGELVLCDKRGCPKAYHHSCVDRDEAFFQAKGQWNCESLGNEAYRALEARNVAIAQTTLGELYQLILNALAKLCNQKKFLAEFERTGKRLGTACDDKYLQIKCKDKSSCDYDELSDSVLCTIAYSDFSSDDDSDTDSLESDSDFGVHMINPIPHPIPVIAFFDTGSSVSILNPNILPDHYWKPHHHNFMAANGEKFVIDKISVPINIRLFSKCVIKRRLLGSSSHGKDLLIGFDILRKLPNLRWSGEGLHYRSFFNPWTAMHRLFVASITLPIFNISSIKQRLIQTCCASSHAEFLTKHPSPLCHPGMNPDHYQLAKEECEQLVSQGIIEPTTSPWACEAFYVNKRSEQVREKLRLVINYQPLNHLLADDKFSLPQKKSLFEADAKVLSKFDLKSGFWQLGIKPEDRLTAFCIPDHHYQWKVMPFGLKNAPPAFQKAMITIFEPILANTLVYIDDILLFSPDEQSHAN